MPEQTGREPLADAFFQFRMQAPEEIVVPGTSAAHRTVRRRRTARISAVGALTALVLAAGGYSAATLGAPAPAAPAAPSAAPSPTVSAGPTLGPQQLQQLSISALERLGMKPEHLRRGVVYGPVDGATDGFGYRLGTAEQPLPTGRYNLFVFCRGVGRIAVTWQADSGRGTVDSPCTDPAVRFPPTQHAEVRLHAPGVITLSVSADDVARDRAGFAVMVNDPLMTIAETALHPTGGNGLAGGVGMVTGETEDVNPDAKAGTYVLELTCAGTGTVKATLKMGGVSGVKTVRCSEQPAQVTITITIKRAATLKVLMARDPNASPAAVAYKLSMK